jgi:predicted esterase
MADISWNGYQNIQYGNSEPLQISISMPDSRKNEMGAILFIHGINGEKMEYWTFLEYYQPEFVIGIMNYKSKDRNMDELMNDVDAAIMAMYNRALENNITIKNITMIGHSFGGSMALNYIYRDIKRKAQIPIILCVALCAFSDMADPNIMKTALNRNIVIRFAKNPVRGLGKITDRIDELIDAHILLGTGILFFTFSENNALIDYLKSISPVYQIDENVPPVPVIIVHDKDDRIIPYSNSEALRNALEAANIPNVFITTHHLGHSFGAGNNEIKIINWELEKRLIGAINTRIGLYVNDSH